MWSEAEADDWKQVSRETVRGVDGRGMSGDLWIRTWSGGIGLGPRSMGNRVLQGGRKETKLRRRYIIL